MRLTHALASLVLLSACASAAAPSSGLVAVSTAPPARSNAGGLAGLLSNAGQSNAPTLTVIERIMGPADIRRQDGAGIALTYRLDTCALFLVFAPDTGNQMRLAVSHPTARQPNMGAPSLDQCASEARARRGS